MFIHLHTLVSEPWRRSPYCHSLSAAWAGDFFLTPVFKFSKIYNNRRCNDVLTPVMWWWINNSHHSCSPLPLLVKRWGRKQQSDKLQQCPGNGKPEWVHPQLLRESVQKCQRCWMSRSRRKHTCTHALTIRNLENVYNGNSKSSRVELEKKWWWSTCTWSISMSWTNGSNFGRMCFYWA